jgi:hypothetical protein
MTRMTADELVASFLLQLLFLALAVGPSLEDLLTAPEKKQQEKLSSSTMKLACVVSNAHFFRRLQMSTHFFGAARELLAFPRVAASSKHRAQTPSSLVVAAICVLCHGEASLRGSFLAYAAFKSAKPLKRCVVVLALASVLLLLGTGPLLLDFEYKFMAKMLTVAVGLVSRLARFEDLFRSEPPHGRIMGSR